MKKAKVTFQSTIMRWEYNDFDYDRTLVPETPRLDEYEMKEYIDVLLAGRQRRLIETETETVKNNTALPKPRSGFLGTVRNLLRRNTV